MVNKTFTEASLVPEIYKPCNENKKMSGCRPSRTKLYNLYKHSQLITTNSCTPDLCYGSAPEWYHGIVFVRIGFIGSNLSN